MVRKPHHSDFLWPMRWYPILRGTPSAGAQNTREVEKFAIFRLKSSFTLETVQDRPMVIVER